MKKNLLLFSALLFSSLLFGQLKYEVKLLDSTILHPTSLEVKEPFFGRAWLSVDGERYEFKDITHYQNQHGFFKVATPPERAFPQIYKLEKPGNKIGLYSQEQWITSAPMYSAGGGFGGGFSQKVKNWYYAKGEGPIWALSIENLSAAVGDNPEAMKAVKKAKQAKNGTIWMVVGGLGLTAIGFVATGHRVDEDFKKPQSERTNNPLKLASPIMLVGLGILPFTGLPKKAKEKRLRKAVEIYNR